MPFGEIMIKLYCGASTETCAEYPADTGPFACVSPVYGQKRKQPTRVKLKPGVLCIQDSGAFSDNTTARLTFAQAFQRQLDHADLRGYAHQVEAQASYDVLIDEVWNEGIRFKRRWSVSQAEWAVEETVTAAHWIHRHRDSALSQRLILSAQGVDARQYLECTQRLMPSFRDGDILGLGGWCVVGKFPKTMMPVFEETICKVVPFARKEGIRRIHIWGVCYAPALGMLLSICDAEGIALSTDSSGPMLKPLLGEWGYMGWARRVERYTNQRIRSEAMSAHVNETRQWLSEFRNTVWYKNPVSRPVQLPLFDW